MRKFPHYKQLDAMDCGPTCLRMMAKYYCKSYSLEYYKDEIIKKNRDSKRQEACANCN
jgi:ABC-type bacteriocin/lantibiotic exporter with double-glycine peptidase domain